jgi:hypothetical protein
MACWGNNLVGQLGNGTTTASFMPVSPTGVGGIQQLTLSGAHTCALDLGGEVWCWGESTGGLLGRNPRIPPYETMPEVIPLGMDTLEVRTGFTFTCVRLVDGTARCVGANGNQQFGIAATGGYMPTMVPW